MATKKYKYTSDRPISLAIPTADGVLVYRKIREGAVVEYPEHMVEVPDSDTAPTEEVPHPAKSVDWFTLNGFVETTDPADKVWINESGTLVPPPADNEEEGGDA